MITPPERNDQSNGFAVLCCTADPLPVKSSRIRDELGRILSSRTFRRSDRLRRFMSFVVERLLDDAGYTLKEYVIGTEVYGRPQSFDARNDPIVRVEARRLRAKLSEYYSGEGRSDPIEFRLPKGTYLPTVSERAVTEPQLQDVPPIEERIAVERFLALGASARAGSFASGLTVEVLHALHAANAHVYEWQPESPGRTTRTQDSTRRQGAYAVLRGTVQAQHDAIRVLARLTRVSDQMLLWSETFNCSNTDDIETQERFARSVARRVAEHLGETSGLFVIGRAQVRSLRANA